MVPAKDAAPYTRFFCEENVFRLLQLTPEEERRGAFAVFVSNPDQAVTMLGHADGPVTWDYHVVSRRARLRLQFAPTCVSPARCRWR